MPDNTVKYQSPRHNCLTLQFPNLLTFNTVCVCPSKRYNLAHCAVLQVYGIWPQQKQKGSEKVSLHLTDAASARYHGQFKARVTFDSTPELKVRVNSLFKLIED